MAVFLRPLRVSSLTTAQELGSALHEAVAEEDKKRVKRILQSGIPCNYPNDKGETALFRACQTENRSIVRVLLKHGANPNARTVEGMTPVHAACSTCNTTILGMLLEAGGDLRLHDDMGKGYMDFIDTHCDGTKKAAMLEYIEHVKNSSLEFIGEGAPQNISGRKEVEQKANTTAKATDSSAMTRGFGKIYVGDPKHVGTAACIPLITDSALTEDEDGPTFENGSYMIMKSMSWKKVPITVKRLHGDFEQGGNINLLINECEYMKWLRHPNILLMMAVNQTDSLDNLELIYERVGFGSVYSCRYHKLEDVDTLTTCEIIKQTSEALRYIHQMNLVHCCITSHAIYLVQPNVAKLGNFEYMMECVEGAVPRNKIVHYQYVTTALNWAAPEIISGNQPTKVSDIYSVCAVLWELLHGSPPWLGMNASDIEAEFNQEKGMLQIDESITEPLFGLLQRGLALEAVDRDLTLDEIIDVLRQVFKDYDMTRVTSHASYARLSAASRLRRKQNPEEEDEDEEDEEEVKEVVTAVEEPQVGSGIPTEAEEVDEIKEGPPDIEDAEAVLEEFLENEDEESIDLKETDLPTLEPAEDSRSDEKPLSSAASVETDIKVTPTAGSDDGQTVEIDAIIKESAALESEEPIFSSIPVSEPSSTATGCDDNDVIQSFKSKQRPVPEEECATNPFKQEYEKLKSQNLNAIYGPMIHERASNQAGSTSYSQTREFWIYNYPGKRSTVYDTLSDLHGKQNPVPTIDLNNLSKDAGPVYLTTGHSKIPDFADVNRLATYPRGAKDQRWTSGDPIAFKPASHRRSLTACVLTEFRSEMNTPTGATKINRIRVATERLSFNAVTKIEDDDEDEQNLDQVQVDEEEQTCEKCSTTCMPAQVQGVAYSDVVTKMQVKQECFDQAEADQDTDNTTMKYITITLPERVKENLKNWLARVKKRIATEQNPNASNVKVENDDTEQASESEKEEVEDLQIVKETLYVSKMVELPLEASAEPSPFGNQVGNEPPRDIDRCVPVSACEIVTTRKVKIEPGTDEVTQTQDPGDDIEQADHSNAEIQTACDPVAENDTAETEDLYFDDIFIPDLAKEAHMSLIGNAPETGTVSMDKSNHDTATNSSESDIKESTSEALIQTTSVAAMYPLLTRLLAEVEHAQEMSA